MPPGKASGARKSAPSGREDVVLRLSAAGKGENEKEQAAAPKTWICQLAVATTQAAFVVGSVYLKGSLQLVDTARGERFHPVVYAFGREATAGPILFFLAWSLTGVALPARQDAPRLVALGACMFLSQLFYIIGIELSGVVVASCMQPAIPVFTVLLTIALRMESASPQKLAGIALAVAGAVAMVLGGLVHATPVGTAAAAAAAAAGGGRLSSMATGNCCLLVNTMAMACYYVLGKKLVARYPPAAVAGWAYLVAATLMGIAAMLFTEPRDWHFPAALVVPLMYWVVVCSVAGYLVVTWAMRHLPASQVAAFQCLQPFLGSVLAAIVLHERPSWWDLGAVGVGAGLLLVTLDRRDVAGGGGAAMARMRRLVSLGAGMAGAAVRGGGAPQRDKALHA